MNVIFTRSSSPLSKLIRWGLNEPVSHMAIVFDSEIVFHSNLLGVHIEWFDTFSKKSEVVFNIQGPRELNQEEECYKAIISRNSGRPYDFKAFLYFAWCVIRLKVFGTPIPSKNKLAVLNADLCTELARTLPLSLWNKLEGLDLAITSPYQVYLALSK